MSRSTTRGRDPQGGLYAPPSRTPRLRSSPEVSSAPWTGRVLDPKVLGPVILLILSFVAGAGVAAPAPEKAKVQKTTTGGPQLAYERFRRRVQVEVAERREEQIAALLRLLDLGPPEKEKADMQFRLAELYSDKSRFYFFRGQEKDDAILRAKTEDEKAALEAQKKEALEESKAWAQQALDVYIRIRREHPDYPRMPEVLFALGQSHWTRGEFEASLQPYADLIREYPESPLVSEAWIAFGEYYFNEGDVPKALKSYEKAAENKRSRVYGFALYKQGWCYYNLAEWNKALRKFEGTVIFSQLSEEMSGENKIALGREAQADWVRTYVHVGTPEKARFEIARLLDLDSCTDRCLVLLEGLAGLWFEEGYFAESAELYRQLVQLEPDSLKNPLRQAKIVDVADRRGDKTVTVKAAQRLVEIFVATRKRFDALPEGSKEKVEAESDLEEAGIVAETTLRRLAQEWNKEARKTRQDETFARAERMYAFYLDLFPEGKPVYEMRFQYADLLYKLERFDDAAKRYRAVVESDPKGKHLEEAANDNILAIEEHHRDLALKLPTNLKSATDLHPEHQRLVDATERYLTLVPAEAAAEKRPAVELKAARVYYAYNQFPEALKRFEAVVSAHPKSEQAVVAANLAVDIHNLQEDWQALYDAARRYLDNAALMDGRPKLRDELERFGEYAKFALVQKLEKQTEKDGGDLGLVAKGFEDFYREFPRSENADEALFNASLLWDKVGDKARASALRAELLERYPTSPLRADVAFYVAKQHEERTEYAAAAQAFASFAKEFPNDARARDALYDASVFYAGTGQVRVAATLRESYLAKYGRTKGAESEAEAVEYAIAQDLDRGRRWTQAVRAYAAFAKRHALTPRGFDAMWREAEIRRTKLRQRSAPEKIEGKILGTVRWMQRKGRKVPPNALRYASLVAFERLDDDFRDYRRLRIRKPNLRNPRPFQTSLREKARARDRMIRRYTSIVTDYKEAESSIAALYRIARAWDVFVADLTGLPCPRGVPEEVCGELRAQLEELSLPAQESAVTAYKTCVSKSNDLEVFTAYSTKCAKRLERLAPHLSPPVVERTAELELRPELERMESNALILNPETSSGRASGSGPATALAPTAAREESP